MKFTLRTPGTTCCALIFVLLATTGCRKTVDLIVHNANVYTMDGVQPSAAAFAVADGRFVAVGDSATIFSKYVADRLVDAGDATVVPGLIDAHAHLRGQGLAMLTADLVGTASIGEIVDRLRDFERTLPAGAWLTGRGWDQNDWPPEADGSRPFPTRRDLDAVFPDRPVLVRRVDGHASWANTAALRVVGMETLAATQDPAGGKIQRDERGQPTGVFVDAAMGIVSAVVTPFSRDQVAQALQLAIGEVVKYGLTGIHDAGIDLETIRLYQEAIDAGRFNVRLYGMIGGTGKTLDVFCSQGPLVNYGDRLTVRAVKLYADGALGSRGAALLDDYADDPGNVGLLQDPAEELTDKVRRVAECGFQPAVHAIGDRANRVILDAYEKHAELLSGLRPRIEHAQILAENDLPRFARLDVIPSMQPTHATSDMYWAGDRLGRSRLTGAYAWQSLLDSGVRLPFGSDFPVEKVNPILGFHAAVTRQDAMGFPDGAWLPTERVSREDALRGFTSEAAFAGFMEDEVGSITAGKWADFVFLNQNIMTVPAERLLDTRVLVTYLAGIPVYEAGTHPD